MPVQKRVTFTSSLNSSSIVTATLVIVLSNNNLSIGSTMLLNSVISIDIAEILISIPCRDLKLIPFNKGEFIAPSMAFISLLLPDAIPLPIAHRPALLVNAFKSAKSKPIKLMCQHFYGHEIMQLSGVLHNQPETYNH